MAGLALQGLHRNMFALTLLIALVGGASWQAADAHDDVSKICGEKQFFLRVKNSRWDSLNPEKCSLASLSATWTPGCAIFVRNSLELKKNEEDTYDPIDGAIVGNCITTQNEWQLFCSYMLDVPAVGTLTSVGYARNVPDYPFFADPLTWSAGIDGFEGVTAKSEVRTVSAVPGVEMQWHLDHAPGCSGTELFTFAVMGDTPYGVGNSDYAQLNATPAFIQTINDDESVSLVAHIGDIHAGSMHCYEWYNWKIYNYWKAFNAPVVYAIGDNEWADCNKAKEGGWTYNPTDPWHCLTLTGSLGPCDSYYNTEADGGSHYPGDPLDNLELVRRIFFQRPGSTLGTHKSVLSQSHAYDPAYPTDAKYVENVMFVEVGVLFVVINIPGGSNNEGDAWYGAPITQRQQNAAAERTAATIRWINRAFEQAWAEDTSAIVLLYQADFWHIDGKPVSHLAGYTPIVQAIYTGTRHYGRPVLALHGDSHVYKSDNPFANRNSDYLAPNTQYGTLEPTANFHRVVVHGETLPMEYLKVTINPKAYYGLGAGADATQFGPFTWTRAPQPGVL
eukprot:jgi/Mesvir1/15789/Mv03355-RA.1